MLRKGNHQLYVPTKHGDKDLMRFTFLSSEKLYQSFLYNADAESRRSIEFCVMYDQEPIMPNIADIYKQRMMDHIERHHRHILEHIGWTGTATAQLRPLTWPIWCTSEFSGIGLEQVKLAGFIPCRYFYHAFIARDWFRFWQMYPDLQVQDKSDATYRFLMYSRDTTGTRQYRTTVADRLAPFKHKIKYHWDRGVSIPSTASASIDIEDAGCAAIHLVLETLFDYDSLYLTEKVFKPMVMSQPFIIWGPPGSLELLRRYGFQTFDHVWSEEYDTVSDHDNRMDLLIDLVCQLANMSATDFKKLYKKCLPVIEHNRRRFYSAEFMETCYSEMSENISRALQERHTRTMNDPGGQFFSFLNQNRDYADIPFVRVAAHNLLLDQPKAWTEQVIKRYPGLVDL